MTAPQTPAERRQVGLSAYTLDALAQARGELLEDLAAIDAILARNGRAVDPVPGAAPSARGGSKARFDWPHGRRLWEVEGLGAPTIAARLGCTVASVYFHAKHEQWGRRRSLPLTTPRPLEPGQLTLTRALPSTEPSRPAKPAPPTAPPRRPDLPKQALPRRVICDWCQLYTGTDPCDKCHRPPKRYK